MDGAKRIPPRSALDLQAQALEAHRRLLASDPLASRDLCELLLDPLVGALQRRWSDPSWSEAVHDTAVDTLMDHFRVPERYDPTRATLLGWLIWQANADLINAYHATQQRFERAVITEAQLQADHDDDRDELQLDTVDMAADPAVELEDAGALARIRAAFPDRRERELIWRCWVEGDRSTEAAAEVLGLTGLSLAQQRRQVKNVKDRIIKKLQRMGLADEQD